MYSTFSSRLQYRDKLHCLVKAVLSAVKLFARGIREILIPAESRLDAAETMHGGADTLFRRTHFHKFSIMDGTMRRNGAPVLFPPASGKAIVNKMH